MIRCGTEDDTQIERLHLALGSKVDKLLLLDCRLEDILLYNSNILWIIMNLKTDSERRALSGVTSAIWYRLQWLSEEDWHKGSVSGALTRRATLLQLVQCFKTQKIQSGGEWYSVPDYLFYRGGLGTRKKLSKTGKMFIRFCDEILGIEV